jgi:hypothetical protein
MATENPVPDGPELSFAWPVKRSSAKQAPPVSPNRDSWFLARDPETGLAFVRHEANAPSGGQVTEILTSHQTIGGINSIILPPGVRRREVRLLQRQLECLCAADISLV